MASACEGSGASESRRGQFLLSRNASMRCEAKGRLHYTIYRHTKGGIENDSDLDPLRDDPRFHTLLEQLR